MQRSFKALFLVGISAISFIANVQAATPKANDFKIYKSAVGVKLYKYKCSQSACLSDYVLEVDLTKAEIKSIYNTPSGSANRSKYVKNRTIASHWDFAKSSGSNAFATFNFAFHDGRGHISLPLKVGNDLISLGYALASPSRGGEYPGKYKFIRFNNNDDSAYVAAIYPKNSSLSKTDEWLRNVHLNKSEEIVGAFTPDVNKSCGSYIPRMFMGVADRNGDGHQEILLFSGEKASCNYARDVLVNFGVRKDDVIQGDGGGSAQLVVTSNNNSSYKAEGRGNQWISVKQGEILVKGRQWQGGNNGGRPVPHAFAVYSGNSTGGTLTYQQIIEFVFNTLERLYRNFFPSNVETQGSNGNYYRSYSNGSYLYIHKGTLWYNLYGNGWTNSRDTPQQWYDSLLAR